MRKGFIYNHNKCVACRACSAACILENGWGIHAREIVTFNSEALATLPLINLSLACNHCETAVCLNGCPTSAYSRDKLTNAVIIDDNKCIGCKYCQWNCPYDAPKFDSQHGIIGKCNLCYSRMTNGYLPACTNACPTGALDFGELTGPDAEIFYYWFPLKDLNPAIKFTGNQDKTPLRIIPEKLFEEISPIASDERETGLRNEWSLVVFSFLTTISVATLISSLIKGIFPDRTLFFLIIMVAGIVSLFHLGKKVIIWRAVANLRTSPLSREIVLFILYSLISTIALFSELPIYLVASSIIGLILLIAIDSVYIYADKRKSVLMHSGQTFLSGLLIASMFSGAIFPFLFLALLKLATSVYSLISIRKNRNIFVISFLRMAMLVIAVASLISGLSDSDNLIIILFLTGELIDRILFYIDFKPLNINRLITKQPIVLRYEKERGK